MSKLKIVLGVAAIAAVTATSAAHAARVGVFIGPGWGPGWGPYWGPPSIYYAPPPLVAVPVEPAPPPEYVEQGQPEPAPPPEAGAPPLQPGYWYYCNASRRYYPYVKTCSSGWREVPARPPQ
ncbi:hypothetical protein ACR42A_10840 [Burkholderia gladioli]|uniref:hypothetical protein n=1 Tax=Burkholderia gladioli TaxID=28095 RepID=UPI003DA5A987